MGFERFKINSKGVQEILKSPAVQGVLQSRGEAVAAEVRQRYQRPGWEIVADTQVGRTRARCIVSGVPERDEDAEGIMGGALGAARR